MVDYPRIHSNCGGELTYSTTVTEIVIVNKRAVKKYGAEPKKKQITKTLYKCNKCHDLVNIIVFPSWEEYVMMGMIRVPYHVFRALKEKYKARERNRDVAQR